MANEPTEWYKIIGVSGLTAILGWLSKKYDWLRLKPKEAIEVKKVEQEIKSDSVTTAIDLTNLMLTRLTQAETRLTDVQNENDGLRKRQAQREKEFIEENDTLRNEITSLKSVISDTKIQMRELVNSLEEIKKRVWT